MNARRLLFVDPPRLAGLKPVYLAFLAIAVLALLGFALAFWPSGLARSDYRPTRGDGASSTGAQEGGSLIPSRVRDLPGRTRRM
jgi:hypothetical protein